MTSDQWYAADCPPPILVEAVDNYEAVRLDVFAATPGTDACRHALWRLHAASRELHTIERSFGIPIGTTRERAGLAKGD